MTNYFIPTEGGIRVREGSLRDAYQTAAMILYGLHARYGNNIHRGVTEYSMGDGLPIYNTATGKAVSHWVRFANGKDPSKGWEKVSYSPDYGVSVDGPYRFRTR